MMWDISGRGGQEESLGLCQRLVFAKQFIVSKDIKNIQDTNLEQLASGCVL